MLLMLGLGLVSLGTAVGWASCAVAAYHVQRDDELDDYDVGADSLGVVIFVPALLSLVWLAAVAIILATRAVTQKAPATSVLRRLIMANKAPRRDRSIVLIS